MAITQHDHAKQGAADRLEQARKRGMGLGLLKGMVVLLKHLFRPASHNVIQYPDEKQELSPRTRGVIALKEENCTVCMLCGRECPDWCIYIDSHKEQLPPKREGGRPRKRNVLDRFAIDYALCMYCGICVEVCPYDALFWSREFEYAEYDIRELTHEKERLSDWMASVLPPPPLEEGAWTPGMPEPELPERQPTPTTEATGARPATVSSSAAEARTEQAAVAPKAGTVTTEPARPTESLPEQEQRAETESVPEPKPAAMAPETRELGQPGVPAGQQQEAEPAEGAEGGAKLEAGAAVEQTTPEDATEQRDSAARGELTDKPEHAETPTTGAGAVVTEDAPGAAAQAPAGAPPPTEDPEAVYRTVLKEQLDKGSSPQVAEARAKVARVKAERGIARTPTPVETSKRVPSAPTKGERTEPVPPGAPEGEQPRPEQGPVAPQADEEDRG